MACEAAATLQHGTKLHQSSHRAAESPKSRLDLATGLDASGSVRCIGRATFVAIGFTTRLSRALRGKKMGRGGPGPSVRTTRFRRRVPSVLPEPRGLENSPSAAGGRPKIETTGDCERARMGRQARSPSKTLEPQMTLRCETHPHVCDDPKCPPDSRLHPRFSRFDSTTSPVTSYIISSQVSRRHHTRVDVPARLGLVVTGCHVPR